MSSTVAPTGDASSGAASLQDNQIYGIMVEGIMFAVWLIYVAPLFGKLFGEKPISKLRNRIKSLFTFDGRITD